VRLKSIRAVVLITIAAALAGGTAVRAADPAAAERQYKIARRLVVEGSPEAATALQKVIELDPQGDLVDDALVDQALLLDIARWPEQLGVLEVNTAIRANELLTRATDEFSLADRAPEARYLRALLRLEPLPLHDASDAGLELVTVATMREPRNWAQAARYALGWLAEQQVKEDRALEAYQRLIVDAPFSDVAPRAEAGIGRLMLRQGDYAEAARWLQRAVDHEAPEELRAAALMELAVRLALIRSGRTLPAGTVKAAATGTGIRSLVSLNATPDGGVLLSGDKSALVLRYDASGQLVGRWALQELQAATISPPGKVYAAAGEQIYLLENGQPPRAVAALGDFAPLTALTADGLGGLWVLDRRGDRVGRVVPGSGAVRQFVELKKTKLSALRWDGRRLVAIDDKTRGVITLDTAGTLQPLPATGLQKPETLAAGPAGQLAAIDNRSKAIIIVDAGGESLLTVGWDAAGVERPIAVDIGPDGSMVLFDGANQRCMRVP
jgi:tetratricopeptide (TPR) repeat protein